MPEILVTGGTGALGRELVPRLITKGYGVRVLSRKENPAVPAGARAVKGDLLAKDGLREALDGVDVIAHCATSAADSPFRGLTYNYGRTHDVAATTRLLDAARGTSPYFLYISIVGIDKIPLGYYRTKLDCERAIEASALPYTILRTTQWHTLAWEFCRRLARGPIVFVPKGVRSQLLDSGEVADRMCDLVAQGPSQHAPEMGGPAVLEFDEIARAYLHALAMKRPIVKVSLPGKAMKGFRAGHNLTPEHADGKITWEEWLAKNRLT